MSKELHSSYWLDYEQFKYDAANFDLVDLMEYRQTIKNFVSILTGKDIPVRFKTSKTPYDMPHPDGSFTDGKYIQIAALRKNSKFDVNVGLALHEASHVVLTDFKISTMFRNADYSGNMVDDPRMLAIMERLREYYDILYPISASWHKITNLFEDVRIDEYVIKTAPGYKGYYDALYNEYLFNDKIKSLMIDPRSRTLTIDNYLRHLMVYKRPDRIPNALPGLAEMYNIIDNTDIAGMKNTYDVAEFAGNMLIKICEVIHEHQRSALNSLEDGKNTKSSTDVAEAATTSNGGSNDSTDNDSTDDAESPNDGSMGDSSIPGHGPGNSDSYESEGSDGSTDSTSADSTTTGDADGDGNESTAASEEELTSLSNKEQTALDKAMQELNDFINHKINQDGPGGGAVQKADAALINQLDEKAIITKLPSFNDTKCIYIPKVKPSDYVDKSRSIQNLYKVRGCNDRFDNSIQAGLAAAKLIERKLAVREEERITEYTHLKSGRVDSKRLAYATLIDDIFKKSYIESYPESYIHISVDASSSMVSNNRIESAIEMLVALAKGTENLKSIHLKIDFRGTVNYNNNNKNMATSIVAYDSKYNSVNDFLTYIKYMTLDSITPESLCYESIANDMMRDSAGKHAIFITLTDGEPNMHSIYSNCNGQGYNYITAVPHIKKMMKKFHNANIGTLAYFIDGDEDALSRSNSTESRFKESYGSSAHFISSGDFRKLLATINKVELSTKVVNIH